MFSLCYHADRLLIIPFFYHTKTRLTVYTFLFVCGSLLPISIYAQGTEEEEGALQYNLLSWSLRNKDPEQAKAYGLLAVEAATNTGNTTELIRAYSFTGVAYRNLGYYEEALRYYSLGLDLALETHDKKQQCYAYINLANLHLYLKKPAEAVEQLKKITRLVTELNDPNISGYYHLNLGRAYTGLHLYEKATKALETSLSIRVKNGEKNGQSVCKKYLGDLYLQMDDAPRAVSNYQQSLELMDKEWDKDLLSANLNGLALAQLANQRPEEAKNHALNALATAKEINSLFRMKEASHTLAEVHRKIGDSREVEHYLKDVIHYARQLYTESLQKQAEQFAILLKNKELEYEKARLVMLHKEQIRAVTTMGCAGVALVLIGGLAWFHRKKITLKNQHLQAIREQNQWLEEKVNQRTIEIEGKNKKLEELSKFKESLTQMIAHDLVNQLSMVLHASEAPIDMPNLYIRKAAMGMLHMVNNMVDIQKFEDATVSLSIKPLSLPGLINNARDQVQLLLTTRRITINTQGDCNVMIAADENMLLRVLINLLTNGIRHSGPGSSIEITCESNPLTNRAKIGIHDHGSGIPEDQLPFIFEKYWHGKNNETGGPTCSSGIGLTFCKLAIEAHQGHIWVESNHGHGTSFFFDLALSPTHANGQETTPNASQTFAFTEEEKALVQTLANELRTLPIYEVSTIRQLLAEASIASENYRLWSDEVIKACYAWDEKYFYELLSNL